MVGIVPKKDAPGVSFCGINLLFYIVRSDLGCYMSSTNFHTGDHLSVYALHSSCKNGDHYLADLDAHFYIIKGTSYRRVNDINTDEGAVISFLHPSCQGGDHYFSASDHFYILFQSQGVYRTTTNLNTYADGVEYALQPSWDDCLYGFGVRDYYYFVKPHDEWGVQYCQYTDFSSNEEREALSFHPSVINFLPGGLGMTQGPSRGAWEIKKSLYNGSQSEVTCTSKMPITVGFEEENMSSILHDWNFSAGTDGLSALLLRRHFALPACYGGSSLNTECENWNPTTMKEENIDLVLESGQKMFIWQYHLRLGDVAMLFCRYLTFSSTSSIHPTETPLFPAKP